MAQWVDGRHVKRLTLLQSGSVGAVGSRVPEPQPQGDAHRHQCHRKNRARKQKGKVFKPTIKQTPTHGSAGGDPLPHFRLEARGWIHPGFPSLEIREIGGLSHKMKLRRGIIPPPEPWLKRLLFAARTGALVAAALLVGGGGLAATGGAFAVTC